MNRSRWNVQYMQRVLATDPIAHWMQDEKQLAVSYDMVTARSDGARNGLYTGVTLGQPGIGDGRTSAQFDGATSYDNIYSASLNAAFNGQLFSMMTWIRAVNAGVWTDGANRTLMFLFVDGNNRSLFLNPAANNSIQWTYEAGGVVKTVVDATFAGRTDWISLGMTVDRTADQMIAYLDGAQTGAIQNGLGVYAGNLDAARTLIGAANSVGPANVWDGYEAHSIVWPRALPPAEMLSVGVR